MPLEEILAANLRSSRTTGQDGFNVTACVSPCRLCTRSTMGLHEEVVREPLNGTGAQRHLLTKNSVTAAFSAQSLWAAGYQGKGVRMGVFDTGIRDDHPHVKNIKCAPTQQAQRARGMCGLPNRMCGLMLAQHKTPVIPTAELVPFKVMCNFAEVQSNGHLLQVY